MNEVRFKITENGLQEITATTPVITFDEGDNSVDVKRGGEISYLAGVSVSDESENVPISKVESVASTLVTVTTYSSVIKPA